MSSPHAPGMKDIACLPDSRQECIARYGHMSQVARLKRLVLMDGKAAGTEAVDIDTGGGLCLTVLPGRGMDIAWASYRGIPLSYIAKPGLVSASYHDPRGMQWLKSFFGGLLTTCGLGNAGPPCEAELPILGATPFGLHGDISNTAADNVCLTERWDESGRYRMQVSGRVQEGRLHAEHLEMRRTLSTCLGSRSLKVTDEFCNLGDTAQPLMFFYHINLGYPILSETSRFLSKSLRITPANPAARAGLPGHDVFTGPVQGAAEQQFYHEMAVDGEGLATVALVNEPLGLGVFLRYAPSQLPCFAQWKVLRTGEYVLAFEPGNCHPIGRAAQEKSPGFEWLAPAQTKAVNYEIGVLDGPAELARIARELAMEGRPE